MDANWELKILIRKLKEKEDFLEKIYELTMDEVDAVKNEDVDNLENILEKRKMHLIAVDKLDQDFLEKFDSIKERYQINNLSELQVEKDILLELQYRTKNVKDLLLRVKNIEDSLKKDFVKQLDKVKQNLMRVNKGKKATSNYHKEPIRSGGTFLDKKN